MSHDNVFALKNPAVANEVRDALTEVLREGARTLLAQAIEAEVAEFLARHAEQRDAAGSGGAVCLKVTRSRPAERQLPSDSMPVCGSTRCRQWVGFCRSSASGGVANFSS